MLNSYSLEQRIEEEMRTARVPGLALAIVRGQEVVYARGFGVTSVEDSGTPVTSQTLFRIGSTTKPLTGTAVMRLVDAGKLDLDRPIREYVNWFTLSDQDATERVTLRMLMSHRAGLPTAAEHFGRRDPGGLEAHVRQDLAQYPLLAPPGKVWSYSNPGVNVVGYVAEVAAGKPYADLMRELVFEPLDMRRTTFDPTIAMTYPLAQSHDLDETGALQVQHRFAENVAHYPSGFAMSTVLDLASFAIMQMDRGRFRDHQILTPESVAEMQKVQAEMYTADQAGYGLTFGVHTYKGVRLVHHQGAISTYGSWFVMAPSAGVAVVLLCNRASDFWGAGGKLVDRILDGELGLPDAAPETQPAEPDRSLWPRYVGRYLGETIGLAVIRAEDDRLTLDLNGEATPLAALRKDVYFSRKPDGGTTSVGFVPEPAGACQYITVDSSPCHRIERDAAYRPQPGELASFVGTYASTEIGGLTARQDDDRLIVSVEAFGAEVPCVPVDRSRFASSFGVLEFLLADDGTVSAVRGRGSFVFTRAVEPPASAQGQLSEPNRLQESTSQGEQPRPA